MSDKIKNLAGPPPLPWGTGKTESTPEQAGFESLAIEVGVAVDDLQQIFSYHTLKSDEDEEVALGWPGGGQQYIAYALLTEATRREAILAVLVNMSNDGDFLAKVDALSPEEREELYNDFSLKVCMQMGKLAQKIARECVVQAFDYVKQPE